MLRAPRRLIVVCLLLLVVPLSACGSGKTTKETNTYVAEVNAIENEVASQFRLAGTVLTPTSTRAADRQTLAAFSKAITTAATKLRAVKAPSKVRALHEQLVQQVASYSAAIAAARKGLAARTTAQVTAAQTAYATATAQTSSAVTAATDAINRKLHE